MCMMQRFHCLHHRIETRQEERSKLDEKEQRSAVDSRHMDRYS